MAKLKIFVSFLFLSLFLNLTSQVSLSTLKSSGIKSENDLKKLGLSETEIQNLKSQYLNKPSKIEQTDDLSGEISEPKNESPVINEKPISTPKSKTEPPTFPVFGQNIFQNGSFQLVENSDRITPSTNYTLGTSDRISITIWGASEYNNEFTLDEFGNISPKLVGRVSLKGLTFAQAKKVITSRFSKIFNLSSSQIAINLSYSKVISVNIVGEVKAPGTYSVPSINSAFNILSFYGGVTTNASIREIEIRRNGKVVSTLDIYEFISKPKKYAHFFLQDGDFIVVKPLKKTVQLKGEILKEGSFEIKESESLNDIINYAGGITPLANKDAIGYTTIEDSKFIYKSINLDLNKNLELKPSDVIEIFKISELVHGMVQIIGSINLPGKFELKKGDKLSDLLLKAKGPTRLSYNKIAHIIRTSPLDLSKSVISIDLKNLYENKDNDILLQELDLVKIYNKSDLFVPDSITVFGKVLSPNKLPFFNNLTLNDVIILSNGLKKEADSENIQVERILFHKQDSSKSYIEIIKLDLSKDGSFKLAPFDKIHFRALPEFKFHTEVTIRGEVRYPGIYTLDGRQEKLSSLINRAGGLSKWAFLEGATLVRKNNDLGLLLMNMKEVLSKKDSKYDYILEPGDVISVPKINNLVSISGAIGFKHINESQFTVSSPYHNGKRAGFYIRKYGGGYDMKAKKKEVYVVSSNGKVKETWLFGLMKPKIQTGDKIIVDYKVKSAKKMKQKNPVNWNNIIENTTVKITGLLTLLILANNVFTN